MTVAHKFKLYYSLCPLRDGPLENLWGGRGAVAGVACVAAGPHTRQNHFALYRRFRASPTQARAGEVQKNYSRKGKLNGKKFMYAN